MHFDIVFKNTAQQLWRLCSIFNRRATASHKLVAATVHTQYHSKNWFFFLLEQRATMDLLTLRLHNYIVVSNYVSYQCVFPDKTQTLKQKTIVLCNPAHTLESINKK